jgi:hypothetical protein
VDLKFVNVTELPHCFWFQSCWSFRMKTGQPLADKVVYHYRLYNFSEDGWQLHIWKHKIGNITVTQCSQIYTAPPVY